MLLLEKIFQRNDKIFIQLYFIILGIFLYLSSMVSYYFGNGTFLLPEDYMTGTVLIIFIFWISALIKIKDNRYIIGAVQFFRIEFILLIQTLIICIVLTTIFKVTNNYSRFWLFSNFVFSLFSIFILKIIFDKFYFTLITQNIIQRNVLLVGDFENCNTVIKKFPKEKSNSVIKCAILTDKDETHKEYFPIPLVQLSDDLNYILSHHFIGQVWLISSNKNQPYIEKLIDRFLNFSVDCRLVSPESKFKFIEGLDSESGFDFYNVSFSPFYGINLLIKNIIDKILSIIFLIISFPIIVLSCFFVLLEDGFPLFFKQKRTGWDGKTFYITKIRTLNKRNIDGQVISGDKRITKVGRFIRRFSIDELPQFLNVLQGRMSIVGPRPHPLDQTKHYSKEILNFMQRHKCPPGLTGWAQVNGLRGSKNIELMDKRIQHDLYYIKNWTIMFDLYIILRTFFTVLFQKKAD